MGIDRALGKVACGLCPKFGAAHRGSVVFGWRAPRPPRVVFVLGFVSLINSLTSVANDSSIYSNGFAAPPGSRLALYRTICRLLALATESGCCSRGPAFIMCVGMCIWRVALLVHAAQRNFLRVIVASSGPGVIF